MRKHKCKQCGYKWDGRKNHPKSCPRCKRYDWNKRKVTAAGLKRAKERATGDTKWLYKQIQEAGLGDSLGEDTFVRMVKADPELNWGEMVAKVIEESNVNENGATNAYAYLVLATQKAHSWSAAGIGDEKC